MTRHTDTGPWSRRKFMLVGMGGLLMPAMGHATQSRIRVLSPMRRAGVHFAGRLDLAAAAPKLTALPMRGHGMLVDPRRPNEALVIARRPGTHAIKIDLEATRVLRHWQAQEDRHFFGHACYSADGATLFVTENNIDTGYGLVTVRSADDFRVLAEYPTHGIDPHDIVLLADGVTLAVANGGVRTLPETGRVKLNRGRIESSLVYLDSRDGRLLGKYPVPSTQLSLRHLAVAPDGCLAAALQFEGDRRGPGVPLMMFHRGESALQFAHAPQAAWDRMRHYAASIAYDPASTCFAMSCPLGGVIACWRTNGTYAGHIDLPKVSGIAFDLHAGFASNELGDLYRIDVSQRTATLHVHCDGMQWDNHLTLTG